MLKKLSLIITVSLAASLNASACDINGNSGFMPENDMYISVNAKVRSDMTEERFNEIIDRADKFYRPIIEDLGGKLKWSRGWNDGTVNASAQRQWKTYKVNMYGGLARHALVTDDAFAMVVCHELGHHLGGAPKIGNFFNKWASNEGQSDYFAALKCFRRMYESDDNIAMMANVKVPTTVVKKCEANYSDANDIALCKRISLAGKSLADLLGSLRSSPATDFDTPDTGEVNRTNNSHPAAQCRLDTYFQGAICDKRISDALDNKDPLAGTCNRSQGYTDGVRPLCWYNPKK